jgi:hypothetical protein
MKHAAALGLGLALLLAGPAFAQQGGHIMQRPQTAPKVGRTAPQSLIQPAQPFQAPPGQQTLQEKSGVFGAMKQQPPSEQGKGAFNTRMKPLGGPGYVPGQLGR